jgi:superfamily II DNA or RNA helicase/diadenosine tetraphosphate (Ap4A) HIT family hydrolase
VNETSCPFCKPDLERCFHSSKFVIAIWDGFPVSPGHTLLITRRHIPSWFEATHDEQAELLQSIEIARRTIEKHHAPDGYNIGINCGSPAGQTIPHLHVHLIPRYTGDVTDPRGGVRHVIPAKANYLLQAAGSKEKENPPPHLKSLIRGGEEDPLFPHLIAHLDDAKAVDIAVAFTMESGVRMISEHLRDVLDTGGRVRIVTGDYLGVTQPEALLRLLDLQGNIQVRIFECGSLSFHPKTYIVVNHQGVGIAFVGSSNLSGSALRGGIEWNFRAIMSSEDNGFLDVANAFETLFRDSRTRPLDAEWVREYRKRRVVAPENRTGIVDPPIAIPTPHQYQSEALQALSETRAAGNTAGLVVLATGLGKTWLSAFDSNDLNYSRILFVAHREEILTQAMKTFRAIRPSANLGLYTGLEKNPDADVIFASIQTLARERHLLHFDPVYFDYIIVDEFHHAAATTYRRVISYFEPKFLLGLTATPERTDGGDLLSLCGDNLVYRRDVPDGIRLGLLSPFSYYGVPDEVNYENIPWRNSRFDEEELTNQVATNTRAQNALEQLEKHGGKKTIGFCVSLRHADFMSEFFRKAGLRAVAVHSGQSSAPRAHSLEQLQNGDLDIVFAVDMFNEGVDLPDVDTILMIRPTESRILWLQQFGRGLRQRPGKILRVIDYIGNHRVFLTKTRALLNLGDADRDVAYALDQLERGTFDLPPGCSVTYELETIKILRALIEPRQRGQALEAFYEDYKDRVGQRPLALETLNEGYNPISARPQHQSWLDFVQYMGDFTSDQESAWNILKDFLRGLEITRMTRSYKIILLMAMLSEDQFPGKIHIDALTKRFSDLARRYTAVRAEIGNELEDPSALRKLIEENPINAWVGGRSTGDTVYFQYDGEFFGTTTSLILPQPLRIAAQELVGEIAEWRLGAYLHRSRFDREAGRIICKVSHSGDKPILFLPSRDKSLNIPEGWRDIFVDNEIFQAKFVKIAVNVVTRPGSEVNFLPDILWKWFGKSAGKPGKTEMVVFENRADGYVMKPFAEEEHVGPTLWTRYQRADAIKMLGLEFRGMESQSGIIQRPDKLVFFVTLEKENMPETHRYKDKFLSTNQFQWQSQNRNSQASSLGQDIRLHGERGINVYLFVRRHQRLSGRTQPFLYCGVLNFEKWEGEKPITVWWKLSESVPEKLWDELSVPQGK